MWASVVVVAVQFTYFVVVVQSFIFYCETMARASTATLWNNWLVQKKKTMQNVKNLKTMHLKRVQFHDYIS